jgi:hypothetical protein
MLSILIGVLRTGISPMPSSQAAIKQILAFVPAGDGPIFELGSGWGTLAIPLARAHPKRDIVCYELSTIPWLFSVLRARLSGAANLVMRRGDFFQADLSEAQVVVCYLYPGGMTQLQPKLERELSPGAVVLSNTFALPGWKAEEEVKLDDLYRTPVYRYGWGAAVGQLEAAQGSSALPAEGAAPQGR